MTVQGTGVPFIVTSCLEFIEQSGLFMAGVYRLPVSDRGRGDDGGGNNSALKIAMTASPPSANYTLGRSTMVCNEAMVQTLRTEFNQDALAVNLVRENCGVGEVIMLLLMFFRELPEKIIPVYLTKEFLRATSVINQQDMRAIIKDLINQIPGSNNAILTRLCVHLSLMAKYGHLNKTTVSERINFYVYT